MITSTANAHVQLARSLHERKGRTQESAFILEGVRLVDEALNAGASLRLALVEPEALRSTARGSALLERLAGLGANVVEVSARVMASAAGTVSPQGILAVAALPPMPSIPAGARLVLVLDAVQDPGNLGTILRSAAAAGVGAVVTTAGAADAYAPKTVRSAMGAHFCVPILPGLPWAELAKLLAGRKVLLAEAGSGTAYDRVDWLRPAALIIGGEPHGAGAEARALAQERVSIPMAEGAESLNAAAAAAILMFEARRQWLLDA